MGKFILNSQQQQAVEHIRGPLMVIAGAGTGKTTVITEHIKYLIRKKVSPSNILAVTFTDKAANEMLERLDKDMPLGYEEPWLGTFHSICDRILRSNAIEIGLDPDYKILSKVDQWVLIRQHLFDFKLRYYRPLSNPTKFISALITFFSRAQDEDVNPEQLISYAMTKKNKARDKSQIEEANRLIEIAQAYRYYQDIKIRESKLDFGDLINQILNLFRKRISILNRYRLQFRHILVDEFQDTNYAQYQLIKLLAFPRKKANLMVVGDDDQSIFKFRGASISNILNFKKDFPNSKSIVLIDNYRSVKPILDCSYRLIQKNNPYRLENKLKINKKLKNQRKERFDEPVIISTNSLEEELNFTIETILNLVSQRNYTFKDFAILARANSYLEPYIREFKKAGYPYQIVSNQGLFDQEEVRNLINILKVVNNPDDSVNLFHYLHSQRFNISTELLISLNNQSKIKHTSLWSIIQIQKNKELIDLVELIKKYQKKSLRIQVSQLLYDYIMNEKYLEDLTQQENLENQLKIRNINLFFEKIKKYESENKHTDLDEFIEILGLWQEAGENPPQAIIEDVDAVSLLTVHSAKGLEFPVVFVSNLVAGRFPTIERKDPIDFPEDLIKETLPKGDEFIQEERRLLYVAMSRAKDLLYLTYAQNYRGARIRNPSGFLIETALKEIQKKPKYLLETISPSKDAVKIMHLDKHHKIKINHLSYSQMDTFLSCPLKYKYRYILHVPAQPHHSLTFGESIHKTLYDFHRLEQQGKKPSLKKLLFLYRKNFITTGYDSEKHKKLRFLSGISALKKYFKISPNIFGKPLILEHIFHLNLEGLDFTGKIDRIDETDTGFELIDYKTGEVKEQKEVDKDKQLTIYAYAAKEALGINVNKMTLYFIEKNIKLSTSRKKTDFEKEIINITKKINDMRKSEFKAKPGYPIPCAYCEFNRICPFVAKR